MVLTNEQIVKTNKAKTVSIEPFFEEQLGSASYNLRIGREAITVTSNAIVDLREKGFIALEPGETGMFMTFRNSKFWQ